jgi:hypothetical protein
MTMPIKDGSRMQFIDRIPLHVVVAKEIPSKRETA